MYNLTPSSLESFWSRVDKTDSCWNWTGAKVSNTEYGEIWLPGQHGKVARAHRVSYSLVHGDIPKGAHIDHICHNPACVNPDHLRLTTAKQNGENRGGLNKNNTTGVRGVIWRKDRQSFSAQWKHNRVNRTKGGFRTLEEAESYVIQMRNDAFTHNDLDRIPR